MARRKNPKPNPKNSSVPKSTKRSVSKSNKVENKKGGFRRFRPGVVALQEIRRYQVSTELLIKKYKVDNIPNGLVNYSDFCENIDKIFTTKGIEKDPLYHVF